MPTPTWKTWTPQSESQGSVRDASLCSRLCCFAWARDAAEDAAEERVHERCSAQDARADARIARRRERVDAEAAPLNSRRRAEGAALRAVGPRARAIASIPAWDR